MNLSKRTIIASSLSLLLCSSLLASEVYTIENGSLEDAIKKISKISNMTFMADTRILEGKKAPSIKNISGLKNVLKEVLKNTNLEAIIKDKTIIIRKKVLSKESSSLGIVDVIENLSNISEGSGAYTIEAMNTSTRLNLSPRETPQSIVVLTNQKIQDENMQTFRDISDKVVGFNSSDYDSDRVYIEARGFGIDYYQIDGMPTTYDGYQTEQNLAIYDRVEIVRGANGLVTGAGNPAASINFVRKHANSKELTGKASLQAGSWNAYNGTVDLSGSFNEEANIRGRMVVQHKESDSFRDDFSKESDLFYGIIDADLNDQTSIFVGASYNNSDTYGTSWGGLPVFFSDGSLTDYDVSTNFVADWSHIERKTSTIFTGITHTFLNDIKLKANYSYVDAKGDFKINQFSTYFDKSSGISAKDGWGTFKSTRKNTNHIIDMYASIPFSLVNQNHEIVVGFMHNKSDTISYRAYQNSKPVPQNMYNWSSNIDEGTYDPSERITDQTTTQSGIYTVGKFNLLDNLKFIAGLRITNWELRDHLNSKGYENKNVLTPYTGLIFDLNENHSIYTSYTNIFKPQDYRNKNNDILDPVEGNSYEIGIKSEYFDKRLNSAISYFVINKDNVAEKDGTYILGTTDDAYHLVDGVTSKGIEISLDGKITDNWDVGFGYTRFSIKDSEDNIKETATPKKEFTLSSKYKIEKLSLGAGINWQDEFYADVKDPSSNYQKVTQKAFYLVNAMAKYDFSKKFSMQLNINNLFNKKYYTNISFPWSGGNYIFGEPRKTTLTLNYTF